MQKTLLAILGLVVVLAAIFFLTSQKTTEPALIGGQTDDRGCLIAAGYSWSEEKKTCVRPWEEEMAQIEQDIANILAQKYSKPVSEVHIEVIRRDEAHAYGSVRFGQGGPGEAGLFLAVKQDNVWKVVFDGNGAPDCHMLRDVYGFSSDILGSETCD